LATTASGTINYPTSFLLEKLFLLLLEETLPLFLPRKDFLKMIEVDDI
jgi:hypothetical protein